MKERKRLLRLKYLELHLKSNSNSLNLLQILDNNNLI